MTAILSFQKRHRAAAFAARPLPTTTVGRMEVRWSSVFDRACFLVTSPPAGARSRIPCDRLMRDLTNETGCTRAEILAHGRKVRALLFFAEEKLTRSGELGRLLPGARYVYQLPAVGHAF
jgi:hypothetical protein